MPLGIWMSFSEISLALDRKIYISKSLEILEEYVDEFSRICQKGLSSKDHPFWRKLNRSFYQERGGNQNRDV